MNHYQVVIVGGGVAGCATALTLARSGVPNLCMIGADKSRIVRIGESIPPDTCIPLQELGVWDAFLQQEHEKCLGSCSSWGSKDLGYNDFVLNPYGFGWHLDRNCFEQLLSDKVVNSGVTSYTDKRLLGCEQMGDAGFSLRFIGSDGKQETISARFVVDATGAGSALARHLGARRLFLDHLVFVCGFFDSPPGVVRCSRLTLLEATQNGWWYLASIPGNRIVVAFGTDPESLRSLELHSRERWMHSLFDTKFAALELSQHRLRPDPLTVRPAPSFRLDRAAGSGWRAVGDAASAYDPISSQGIYKALSSGIEAGKSLAASLVSGQDFGGAYDAYIQTQFEDYIANRNYFYGLEQRWSDSPFWRKRRERSSCD